MSAMKVMEFLLAASMASLADTGPLRPVAAVMDSDGEFYTAPVAQSDDTMSGLLLAVTVPRAVAFGLTVDGYVHISPTKEEMLRALDTNLAERWVTGDGQVCEATMVLAVAVDSKPVVVMLPYERSVGDDGSATFVIHDPQFVAASRVDDMTVDLLERMAGLLDAE